MIHNPRKIIGIIPNVRGVGGPASFNEKLGNGLRKLGVEITYDLIHPEPDLCPGHRRDKAFGNAVWFEEKRNSDHSTIGRNELGSS